MTAQCAVLKEKAAAHHLEVLPRNPNMAQCPAGRSEPESLDRSYDVGGENDSYGKHSLSMGLTICVVCCLPGVRPILATRHVPTGRARTMVQHAHNISPGGQF